MTFFQNKTINNKRIIWIELLRIIACFSVVLLHISATHLTDISPFTFQWKSFLLYNGLTRFAVPTFIMISGLLYLDTSKKISLKKLYKKYILKLSVIYIFWTILYTVLDLLVFNLLENQHSTLIFKDILKYSIQNPKYHLWYIPTLISLLIVTPILKELVDSKNSKKISEYIILLFFIFKVLKLTILQFNFQHIEFVKAIVNLVNPEMVCNWIGFFILGHYLYKYNIKHAYLKYIYLLGIISIIVGIYLCYYFSITSGKMNFSYYTNFSIFSTLFTISIFVFFKNKLSNIKLNSKNIYIVSIISNCTLGIYLMHPLIRDVLSHFNIDTLKGNAFIITPFLALITFIISFICTYFLRKIPFLSKWIV